MKSELKGIDGKKIKDVDLPIQFNEEFRPDLIKKAVLAIESHNKQPYGAYARAGLEQVTWISKRRKEYKTCYGHGGTRTPKKVLSRRGLHLYYVGGKSPNTVGGRRAHPPNSETIWHEKINIQEKRKAIRSAIAATMNVKLVTKRGHKSSSFVIDSEIEGIAKSKNIMEILNKLLADEMERIEYKKVRAGKGKNRGRKYRLKKGPLIVVSEKCPLTDAAKNLQSVDICIVKDLNAMLLAPGCDAGRLTIWTEKAIEKLGKEKLFCKDKK